MLRLAVLAVCLIQVFAQDTPEGYYCCPPKRWEGVAGEVEGYVAFFKPSLLSTGTRVAVDSVRKSTATCSVIKTRRGVFNVNVIDNYAKGKRYLIFPKQQKCRVFPLKTKYPSGCIPGKARRFPGFFLGAGSNTLDAQTYGLRFERKGDLVDLAITVTREGCIPVGETLTGKVRRVPFLSVVGFGNITAGIKDPSVFDPPDYCNRNDTMPMEIQGALLHREYRLFGL